MNVDTIIRDGTLVRSSGLIDSHVAINDGEIVAIGDLESLPKAEEYVDASGKLVMPGFVDPHVHLADDFNHIAPKIETYKSGSRAAALGGVTTMIDFAWQKSSSEGKPWTEDSSLAAAIEKKKQKGQSSVVDYGVHAVITREDDSILENLANVIEMGVPSIKLFTAYEFSLSNGYMKKVFEKLAELDGVALVHSEDDSVCEANIAEVRENGTGQPSEFAKTRPDYAEAMALDDALRMATELGCKYYGVHTTSEMAANVIDFYQDRVGKHLVRGETCTHYTVYDNSVYEERSFLPLLTPPFREEADVDAMVRHLNEGTLDVVSTDHNGYARKSKEVENWWEAPYGANSIQHSASILHDRAVTSGELSYVDFVRLVSTNPAHLFGMPWKGDLEPGTDADIVIFDPEKTYTIRSEDNASKADFSIYEGRDVTGKVVKTMVRGELVAEDGEITGDSGSGRFVQREIPDWHQ